AHAGRQTPIASSNVPLGATRASDRPHPEAGPGEPGMNWRRFLERDRADAEQRDELEFYVDATAEDYIARGMDPTEARAAAQRKLGNPTLIREEVFRMNTLTFADSILRDARHALRMI